MKFRKLVIAGIVATVSGVTIAAPTAGFDGFVNANVQILDDGDSVNFWGGRSSISYQSPQNIGLQLDATYNQGSESGFDVSFQDTALHLFYRDDQFLLGGLLQRSSFGFESFSVATNIYGVEGQIYLDRLTFDLKAGFQQFKFGDTETANLLAAEARYFLEDNWRLSLGYNNSKFLGENFGVWEVGTEYRLSNSPISVFGKYAQATGDSDAKLYSVGLSYNFGSGSTLIARDRSGASLNPINALSTLFSSDIPFPMEE
jgi:hypothetical protein